MKTHTVILPFLLPRLSDATAAHLVTLLQQLLASIEHHYAPQIARYQRRQHYRHLSQPPPPTLFDDQPF